MNGGTVGRDVAAEIRAIAARQGLSHAELARQVDRSAMWLSRRLTPGPNQLDMSIEDLSRIAGALHVTPAEILTEAGEVRS